MDFGLTSPYNRDYLLGLVSLETLMNTAIQPECESHSDCQSWFKVSMDFPIVILEAVQFVLLSLTNLVFKKQTKDFDEFFLKKAVAIMSKET